MNRVTIVFKTHLDIGFTALASEITRRYPQFIRNAVATADYFRAKNPSPDGFRYCWNVGSWLIDSYFAQATKGDAAFLEKAIRGGDIVWHALPFTMESEIAGLAVFRAGLGRARALGRRLAGGAIVETLDAPLLAPDVRDLLWKRRNPLPRPGAPFHVCLYNNVWGTNFPQWLDDNTAFRFVIRP